MQLKGPTDENGKEVAPSCWHILVYYVSVPWKILFACNPPASLAHGWATFCSSLVCVIALAIAVIKLTHVLGCVTGMARLDISGALCGSYYVQVSIFTLATCVCFVGINAFVLAITVLAAGTSWPDLVASKIAVAHSDTADSGIANINARFASNPFKPLYVSKPCPGSLPSK